MDPQAVKRAVERAFRAVPIPPDDRLVVDSTGYDPECAKILSAFGGRVWRKIDRRSVEEFHDSLPLLTPEGYHSILPAYMFHSVDSYYDLQDVVSTTVSSLTPPGDFDDPFRDEFLRRASLFSAVQKEAVVAYLRAIAAADRRDWGSQDESEFVRRTAPALRFWSCDPV